MDINVVEKGHKSFNVLEVRVEEIKMANNGGRQNKEVEIGDARVDRSDDITKGETGIFEK